MINTIKDVKGKALVVAIVSILLLASITAFNNANADENNYAVKLSQENESTLHMDLGKGVSVSKDKESNLVLTNKDGKVEKLPRNTKDKDGNAVYLVYKKADSGYDIEVHNKVQNEGWAKCTLGTTGGAGGGGLAGAGVGSTVPVIGTAAGAIIGGVSGAASGAAATCFE